MRSPCAFSRLFRYDKWVLGIFWVVYASAAGLWVLLGQHRLSLLSEVPFRLNPPSFETYFLFGSLLIVTMALVFPLLLLRSWVFRQRTEKGLREMVQGVSAATGDAFFRSLALHLSQALEVDCVIIGQLEKGGSEQLNAVVVYSQGFFLDPFSFHLNETIFEETVKGKGTLYGCNARRQFPRDRILQRWEADSFAGTPLFDLHGRPMGVLAVLKRRPFKEIRLVESLLQVFAIRAAGELERKRSEEAILEQNRFNQIILNAIPIPVFFKNRRGIYLGCNKAFERFIGLPKERIIARDISEILPTEVAERHRKADSDLLRDGGMVAYEATLGDLSRQHRHVLFHKSVFLDAKDEIGGLVGTLVDVTEQKKAEETAHYLAHFDPLTGLPNQVLFTDRLNLEIAHSHRLGQKFALFALDLDHFKKINNAFGHHSGDDLLKEVAKRLTETLLEDDTVAKMGGDSFTLLLPSVQQDEHAAKIAMSILDNLKKPFSLDDREIFITASIGIAIYPADGTHPQILLKNADTALHRAKIQGRNQYQFYTSPMNDRAQEQISLETYLRRALEREELTLYYQPQVDGATGRLIGAEALVRWNHPELGMVPPAKFIPLAEETGLIVPIGEWVLRTACQQAKRWQEQDLPPLRISVNLSPRQFRQQDFLKRVDDILEETSIDPACLGMEITESAVMEDAASAADLLTQLKKRGIHISIDDFGTGYSSLGYLKRFPIDMLKIDRSFVADLTSTTDDAAIVSAVIAMAHNLNIKVLAEGVQNEKQRDFLRQQRCDELQGFFYCHPLSAQEFFLLAGKTGEAERWGRAG